MILAENVNEFIYNMKFKKNIWGGIKEASVYENMRKLSDLYEATISKMEVKIRVIQEQADSIGQDYNEVKEKQAEEINLIRRNYIELLEAYQTKINQFMEDCKTLSVEVSYALDENQIKK